MLSTILIVLLLVVVSFLVGKQWLLKRQLRNMANQMAESDERAISVDFVDEDLETVAAGINKRLAALQAIQVDAEKKEQVMKTSISMISHDMRTPLTSVIGYLQLAQKSCTDEDALQNIRIALDRAKYANKLVDDFFELSVVDSKQYAPVMENVNICDVVCEEILAHYLAFEQKGITPEFHQADQAIQVWADSKLLARVVQNLISNAIKYSTGKMAFVLTETDAVTLSISNSVAASVDTQKIFDKFYRSDASRKGEGAGLGLYICRKLVEDMGGSISATCENNQLTIHITLPKAKASAQ